MSMKSFLSSPLESKSHCSKRMLVKDVFDNIDSCLVLRRLGAVPVGSKTVGAACLVLGHLGSYHALENVLDDFQFQTSFLEMLILTCL